MEDLSNPRGRCSYVYFDIWGAYYQWVNKGWANGGSRTGQGARPTAPSELLRFNDPAAPTNPASWALMSAGPDRSYTDPLTAGSPSPGDRTHPTCRAMNSNAEWMAVTQGWTALYDPSNGTTSFGNIWRLSSGAPR